MATVIGIILTLVSAIYVALPFLRPMDSREGGPAATPEERERWERYKAEAYATIKEAEFDREMGKLSEQDFRIVRDKYAAQALEAIVALDQRNAGPVVQAAGDKPPRVAYCPRCGHAVGASANFCGACGVSLAEVAA